jgi:hypothetical protein
VIDGYRVVRNVVAQPNYWNVVLEVLLTLSEKIDTGKEAQLALVFGTVKFAQQALDKGIDKARTYQPVFSYSANLGWW